ncbi:MAG TPA: FtsX-like permease family protein [Dehalococcoidia bacterium]|nr:FtsX-like permease family protein [Dehalococcoidia bacterium]
MNVLQTARTALTAINSNKMRSTLTVLGVIIGVSAVISLMSIGKGSQAAITSSIESLGTNLLFVYPGAAMQEGIKGAPGSATSLTLEDAEALADPYLAPSVAAVAPQVQTFTQVIAGRQNSYNQILGVTPEYEYVRNFPVAEGVFINEVDVRNRSMVVVLGSNVAETLFGQMSPLGQYVKINRRQFKVIGVLESKGSTGWGSTDDAVLAPVTTVQYRLSSQRTAGGQQNVQSINIQAVSLEETDNAIEQITSILRERHRITGEDDFTITSQQDTVEALRESTQVWVVFLGAIAGISLLVGGIGIMNIMLVSVTERTREIGIRKSVGAKRRDILMQFLVEAAFLSLTGGGIGVLVGWGISHFVSGMNLSGTVIQTVMSVDIVVLAVSVSAAIGIVFGLYPAYRAARLNPIDALRYE